MTKEELEKLYRTWDDEKLKSAFKNRKDYSENALAAMHTVLKERNLADFATGEVKAEEVRGVEAVRESQQEYEIKMLGEYISAKAYAQKKLENGVYISGKVTSSRFLWVTFLLFPLAVVSLILAIFSASQGPLFDYALPISVFVTILLIIGILMIYKNSKALYRLAREGNKELFELKHGAYTFRAVAPFSYFTFVDKMEYRKGLITISHPLLYICITNAENESIVMQGNLTALQSPPPTWPHASTVTTPKGAKYFTEVVGHQVKVIQLKKIMDGMHGVEDVVSKKMH